MLRETIKTAQIGYSPVMLISLAIFMLSLRATGQEAPESGSVQIVKAADLMALYLVGPVKDKSKEAQEKARQLVETRRRAVWQGVLAQIAHRENATLFVEISSGLLPPNLEYQTAQGALAMKNMAWGLESEWKQVEGVQTFRHQGDREHLQLNLQCHDRTLAWIERLSDEQFGKLLDGTLTANEVEAGDYDALSGVASGIPDMGAVMIDDRSPVRFQLLVNPVVEYTDPKTGQHLKANLNVEENPKPRPPGQQIRIKPFVSLQAAKLGKLDFGKGSILPLAEVAAKAEKAFGCRYEVDERLASTLYFLNGSFAQESFESAVEQLTTLPPVSRRVLHRSDLSSDQALLQARLKAAGLQKVDVTKLRNSLMLGGSAPQRALVDKYGEQETLSLSSLTKSGLQDAGTLAQGRPGVAQALSEAGIPLGARVSVHLDFLIAIIADGAHFSPYSYHFQDDGSAAPSPVNNTTTYGLFY